MTASHRDKASGLGHTRKTVVLFNSEMKSDVVKKKDRRKLFSINSSWDQAGPK